LKTLSANGVLLHSGASPGDCAAPVARRQGSASSPYHAASSRPQRRMATLRSNSI
jgi:hypothetical protein